MIHSVGGPSSLKRSIFEFSIFPLSSHFPSISLSTRFSPVTSSSFRPSSPPGLEARYRNLQFFGSHLQLEVRMSYLNEQHVRVVILVHYQHSFYRAPHSELQWVSSGTGLDTVTHSFVLVLQARNARRDRVIGLGLRCLLSECVVGEREAENLLFSIFPPIILFFRAMYFDNDFRAGKLLLSAM